MPLALSAVIQRLPACGVHCRMGDQVDSSEFGICWLCASHAATGFNADLLIVFCTVCRRFLAVGTYDSTVRVLSLEDGSQMRAVATQLVNVSVRWQLLQRWHQ